ncbi:MAG: DUF3256 family protein [Muribaculaceae bacterium]|nr:DUF3256 family protein [Muribaculaceae bacterium]
MTIHRQHTLLAVALIVALLAQTAQARTIRDFFASEPGNIFALLPSSTRLDLLDYYDSGQIVEAQNNLGNGTSLISVGDTLLAMNTSESKTLQMRLLTRPGKRDTVIAVIETVKAPVADSRITFYDTQWRPLPDTRYFKAPGIDDFFLRSTPRHKRQELTQTLPFALIELQFDGKDRLTARHGLKEFLTKEEFSKFRPYMVDSLVYEVDGNKIKPVKQ